MKENAASHRLLMKPDMWETIAAYREKKGSKMEDVMLPPLQYSIFIE